LFDALTVAAITSWEAPALASTVMTRRAIAEDPGSDHNFDCIISPSIAP
jgi:hypothetical protein